MSNPNLKQATILRLIDSKGAQHTLLCHTDVTLVAVQAYVADNLPTPCRIAEMIGVNADLSLCDRFGTPAPKGQVAPMILNLTQDL